MGGKAIFPPCVPKGEVTNSEKGDTNMARAGGSASLAELVGEILNKGIVIDAWARVSLVGLEVLTIEARVVVASVDTYLRYAEAIGLTALAARPSERQITSGGENTQDRLPEGEHSA